MFRRIDEAFAKEQERKFLCCVFVVFMILLGTTIADADFRATLDSAVSMPVNAGLYGSACPASVTFSGTIENTASNQPRPGQEFKYYLMDEMGNRLSTPQSIWFNTPGIQRITVTIPYDDSLSSNKHLLGLSTVRPDGNLTPPLRLSGVHQYNFYCWPDFMIEDISVDNACSNIAVRVKNNGGSKAAWVSWTGGYIRVDPFGNIPLELRDYPGSLTRKNGSVVHTIALPVRLPHETQVTASIITSNIRETDIANNTTTKNLNCSSTISTSAGIGGSITPSGSVSVANGLDKVFTINSNNGYVVADVRVDGVSVGRVNRYTFPYVNSNHTIEATFERPVQTSFAIGVSYYPGGSVTPSGVVSVASGQSKTFNVIPNPGYKVADVKVDGASVGAVTTYTFQNVNATHTIDAIFAANPASYTINTSTDRSAGNITPSGPVTIPSGQNMTFTITANAGYRLGDVKIDGTSVGAVGSYTFQNVAANHKITAVFVKNPYTITATAGVGGSISPSGSISVASGQSGQNMVFTIVPNTGFKIADVKVDGASVGSVAGYSFQNITANHTISATFSIKGNDSHEKDEKDKKKDEKKDEKK